MTSRRRGQYTRRARGTPKRYRWLQNSFADVTTVAAAGQSAFDITQGIEDSELQGSKAVRMLLSVWSTASAAGNNYEFNHYVVPMDLDAFAAGAFPEGEVDIKSYYMNENGFGQRQAGAEVFQRYTYDIRTARLLRDARTALVYVYKNLGGTSNIHYLTSKLLMQLP